MDTTLADPTPPTDGGVGFDANCWQICCNGLSGRLDALRTQGLWTDCELIVGSSQGRMLAHRILLGSASPVLAAMFFGPLAKPDRTFYLPNIEPDIFNRLLEFIYTDNIRVETCEVACSLYAAAHYLHMPHVGSVCKAYLNDNVSTKTALQVYELGKMFDENDIMDKCMEVMSRNADEMFSGDTLCWVSAGTLEQLFARPDLSCNFELDLFIMAERWVLANTKLAEDDQASNDNEKITELGAGDADSTQKKPVKKSEDPKTLIRSAVQHIRFLQIDPVEFAKRDMTTLLTEKEILAISLNLLSKDTYMPMPDGFSVD